MMGDIVRELSSQINLEMEINKIKNKNQDFIIKGAEYSFKTYIKYDHLNLPQSSKSAKLYYSKNTKNNRLYEIFFNSGKTLPTSPTQIRHTQNSPTIRKSSMKRKNYNRYGDDFISEELPEKTKKITNYETTTRKINFLKISSHNIRGGFKFKTEDTILSMEDSKTDILFLQERMIQEISQKWINKSFPNHKLIHNNKNKKQIVKEGINRTEKEIRSKMEKKKKAETEEVNKLPNITEMKKNNLKEEIKSKYTEEKIKEEIISTKINLKVNEGLTFIIKKDLFKHVSLLPQANKNTHFLKLNLFPPTLLVNIHAPATSNHKEKTNFFEKLMSQKNYRQTLQSYYTPYYIRG